MMDKCNKTINATSGDNHSNSTTVIIISMISSSLSVLGSFVIFGTYMYIPEIRNATRKLVTCLTLADILTALGVLIYAVANLAGTDDEVCEPQSVITTYSSLVSFYLTVAIAFHIFSTVVFRSNFTSTWTFLLWVNAVSWIVPGIIVCIASEADVLGRDTSNSESVDTGSWCWLKADDDRRVFWMFLSGKAWEFLCYLLTTFLYVILKFYLYLGKRSTRLADIHESLREEDQNYMYVWFVLYALRLWGSVRSMMSLSGVDCGSPGEEISEVFMYMQAVGDPGQAFCNCTLFCFFDKTVRSHLFRTRLSKTQSSERERLLSSDHSQEHPVEKLRHEDTNTFSITTHF